MNISVPSHCYAGTSNVWQRFIITSVLLDLDYKDGMHLLVGRQFTEDGCSSIWVESGRGVEINRMGRTPGRLYRGSLWRTDWRNRKV